MLFSYLYLGTPYMEIYLCSPCGIFQGGSLRRRPPTYNYFPDRLSNTPQPFEEAKVQNQNKYKSNKSNKLKKETPNRINQGIASLHFGTICGSGSSQLWIGVESWNLKRTSVYPRRFPPRLFQPIRLQSFFIHNSTWQLPSPVRGLPCKLLISTPNTPIFNSPLTYPTIIYRVREYRQCSSLRNAGMRNKSRIHVLRNFLVK